MDENSDIHLKKIKETHYHVIEVGSEISSVDDCLKFAEQIDSAIKHSKKYLILSFHPQIFITGSFLGFLVERISRIRDLGGDLMIRTTNPVLLELLRRTHLDQSVTVFPDSPEKHGFSK